WGRRRRVLATAAARMDARLQRRRDGLAPSPQLRTCVLAAAGGLRASGGAAGAKVAPEVQRGRAPRVARTRVRQRADATSRTAGPDLSRYVGRSAFSAPLPIRPRRAGRPAADAGVVAGRRGARDARGSGRSLDAIAPRPSALLSGDRDSGGAGRRERRSGSVHLCLEVSSAEVTVLDDAAAPAAADGAVARPSATLADALASALRRESHVPVRTAIDDLERAMASSGGDAGGSRGGASGPRRTRRPGRRLRSLGSRRTRRPARWRAHADDRRRARC